jgi:hypothetical protein
VPFTTNSRPEESWGVPGNDVPGFAIESTPGDMLMFNHKIKHSSWGGGDRRRMFTLNFEARYADDDLAQLRETILGDSSGMVRGGSTRAYGEVMIRTAGPNRMRHLEQRLANDDVLRTGR